MFFIRYPNMDDLFTQEYNGVNQQQYLVNNPAFFYPNGVPASVLAGLTPENSIRFIAGNNLHAPYLIQSAVGVERRLNRRTTLAINVTDTRGVRQFVTSDINPPGQPNLFQFQSEGLLKQLQVITRVNSQIGSRVTVTGAHILEHRRTATRTALCALRRLAAAHPPL
jgi:hypothetical protein